jgi:OHCU decarboxylase|tara:strand:+ start:27942 stop:28454 length:513 start_codon:yes stop_codon:yes gene_type:complete
MTKFKTLPSKMNHVQFMARFGSIYEHSPWVAERAWAAGITEAQDEIETMAEMMARIVDQAALSEKQALVAAHPDLAGKAAISGDLTPASTSEQAGAGLDQCTEEEFCQFQAYNRAYRDKFGFPFIMAVKNSNRHEILAGFAARLHNDRENEFARALTEIDRIARFRLAAL